MLTNHQRDLVALLWRHNGRSSISNHQSHDCLLNLLFRRRSKKISKLRLTGLCAGNSPVVGEFPAQIASNAENVSIWWRNRGNHMRAILRKMLKITIRDMSLKSHYFEITAISPRGHGVSRTHDDVIKWKHFPRYWPFVWGIHRSPVNSPHKGQWRGALMFSLICTRINGWVNNREAGDLRRYFAHYGITVMGGSRRVHRGDECTPKHTMNTLKCMLILTTF